jgi:hypothetical protein
VLKKIFECETEEMTGKWRKMHNEELYNLYRHIILKCSTQMG